MASRRFVLLMAFAVLLAGCLGSEPSGEAPDDQDGVGTSTPEPARSSGQGIPPAFEGEGPPQCVHPWPCGDGSEWPRDLEGPFGLASLKEVAVESHDGVVLRGWLATPDLPEGVRAPTALWSSPYPWQNAQWPGTDDWDAYSEEKYGVSMGRLVEEGYAVAVFNVRGTGLSGGCFEYFGPNEVRDQARLVGWVADQPWSNGRVAMMGLSYRGTTPWEAAIQSPEPLKTIITAGIVSDTYTLLRSPQGATVTYGPVFMARYELGIGLVPPSQSDRPWISPVERTTSFVPVARERVCPTTLDVLTNELTGAMMDERHPTYYEERRFLDDYRNVTAAVLLAQGFQDAAGHDYQDSAVWHALPPATPKHQFVGQWAHEFPNTNARDPDRAMPGWSDKQVAWLDFWLKGLGDVPAGVGGVNYQDGEGQWHNSTAWPPAQARDEALFLADDALATSPQRGSWTFHARPDPAASATTEGQSFGRTGPLCHATETGELPPGILFTTPPLAASTRVAGNPFAHLQLSSSQPGGVVALALLDLGPNFRCDQEGQAQDVRWISYGAADLRFHEDRYRGTPFPLDEPTTVRVDLLDLAEVVPAGHRVGVFVSAGDPSWYTGQPAYAPVITLHGDDTPSASHVVLPVVEGTLGGEPTGLEYPPRPLG